LKSRGCISTRVGRVQMPCLAVRCVPVADLDVRQDRTPAPAASTPSQATFRTAPAIPVLRFRSLTVALIGLLVAIFAAELAFGIEPTKGFLEPSLRTLLALGGLQYTAVVGSEEWYRMFLAPLMHAGPVHLLLNGIALYLAGRILE